MFRRSLLKYCKDSFNQFFTEETKLLFLSKDEENKFKFTTRLFGNIKFVGELFRRKLVLESIILQVFDMLLGIFTKGDRLAFINDNTVEGAVVLMEKIGHMIDDKLCLLESQKNDLKKQSTEGNLETEDKIRKTFLRLEEIGADSTCDVTISNRVKMLIRNMVDNRATGWEKTKKLQDSGPMKVEELRQKLEK